MNSLPDPVPRAVIRAPMLRWDVTAVCLCMALAPAVAALSPPWSGPLVMLAFLIATYRWLGFRIRRTRRIDDPKFRLAWPLLASAVLVCPLLASYGALLLFYGSFFVDTLSMFVIGTAVALLSSIGFSRLVGQVFGGARPRDRLHPHRRS